MRNRLLYSFILVFIVYTSTLSAQEKHSAQTLLPTFKGLIMAGYQGWFRAAGDGSAARHYAYGKTTLYSG
jgi:hypothetical protein